MTLSDLAGVNNKRQRQVRRLRIDLHRPQLGQPGSRQVHQAEAGEEITFGTQHWPGRYVCSSPVPMAFPGLSCLFFFFFARCRDSSRGREQDRGGGQRGRRLATYAGRS